jgi:hypothetical protein
MLEAYLDESWTEPKQRGVTAIAGYVASRDVWVSVERPWADHLGLYADKGVKTFHAADCCGDIGYGEFARVDTFHRMSILTNLSGLLEKADVQPIWSTVYTEDWNAVVTDNKFLAKFSDPFHLCFEHVVRQLANWARRKANGEIVAPMFACQDQYQPWMTLALQAYGQFDWYKSVLGPIAFGYPSQIIPLQAADLLAHEISWNWDRLRYTMPKTLADAGVRRLLAKATAFNGLRKGGCFDARALKAAIERYNKTGEVI